MASNERPVAAVGKGEYFPRKTTMKHSGGLVQIPPQSARTSRMPGPNKGKAGTL